MPFVSWKEIENIGIITIDHPPVNTLNSDVLAQLELVLMERVDFSIDVVIITSAGEKAFVGGADIHEFPPLKRETGEALCRRGQRIFNQLSNLAQPVIAAINGYALGGGLELALACDFRIASSTAKLGLPEVKLGIIPGYGGTQRLPRLIGTGKAKQLIFSGEVISAQEALHIGLIEAIAPSSPLDEAIEWAQRIAKQAPLAVRSAKKAINLGIGQELAEGLALEAQLFGEICLTEDKREGIEAFLEKRNPQFKGA